MKKERESCLLKVKVQPCASKTEVSAVMADGTVKVRLRAPPERGKANRELVMLLADLLDVSSSSVKIVKGLTSRQKSVRIEGISKSNATNCLRVSLSEPD